MTQPLPLSSLSDEEDQTLKRLSSALSKEQHGLKRLDAYYDGVQRILVMGLAVPPELEAFTTIANWPRITADTVEQRADVEYFRVPMGNDGADNEAAADELWGIWQANDLDEESQMGHLDSLVFKRAYLCAGTREDDEPEPNVPLITVESAFEMIHERDRRTRRVKAALKRPSSTEVTLYLPDQTIWCERKPRVGWNIVDRDEHGLGVVPVEPLTNRARLSKRTGVSELDDVIGLTDAAARAITNSQLAGEVLAVPQRYVLGASPNDFVDQDGKPVPVWETYFGAVWALQNGNAKVGQFSAADLGNFEKIVNHYANLTSGVSGLPTRYYGQYTTNPPSEGSITADESRLIMNAYRKHRTWGGSWERIMRIARRIVDADWDPALSRMETLWRNPETPTRAQLADAVVKLVQANILPVEAAWEELGYSATRRALLRRQLAEQQARDPLKVAADAFTMPPPGPTDPADVADADVPNFDPSADPIRT